MRSERHDRITQIQTNASAGALTRQAEQAGLVIRIRALLTQDQVALLVQGLQSQGQELGFPEFFGLGE